MLKSKITITITVNFWKKILVTINKKFQRLLLTKNNLILHQSKKNCKRLKQKKPKIYWKIPI